MELSIILPCYRGENFIEQSITSIENKYNDFQKSYEVVVVVDGFKDSSYRIVSSLAETRDNLVLLGYGKNRGKGYALRRGFNASRGEYVAFLDSDLDYDPVFLREFLAIAVKTGADIVIGNRRDPRSEFIYPNVRKIASFVFSKSVDLLLPDIKVRDTQAGIKLFRRRSLDLLFNRIESSPSSDGYLLDIHLLMWGRILDLCIVEAPCKFRMRSTTIGVGKRFAVSAITMLGQLIALRRDLKRSVSALQ